ncbi:hypothetical protein [Deinococcus deserti]|uniref:hypothetical protein n=1 Tax=Deinococcus deserti TaxID=310783 RepID=UPI0030841B93
MTCLTDRALKRTSVHRKQILFLCEHVWEHLTEAQGREAARLCFDFLRPGGLLRCAVPDRNFPDSEYQNIVKVGGPGPADHPASDHKMVYYAELFTSVFEDAGFDVDLLEYCDREGRFHYHQWDLSTGLVYRSLLSDHRNTGGQIGFVSIILDARKPS